MMLCLSSRRFTARDGSEIGVASVYDYLCQRRYYDNLAMEAMSPANGLVVPLSKSADLERKSSSKLLYN